MKKQSKKFMLAGVVLLAIAGLLALTSCKNDSVPEQGTSVPEPPSEADWLQEQKKELEGKTEGTYTITAPSYLTEGGLVKIRKLLDEANVPVDLDLSKATGLTYIAAGTFIDCPTLQSVELPSSVTEIGQYAFQDCFNLTSVTIPANVKTIGKSAFAFTDLTKVAIPEGVTTIGAYAFQLCSSLAEVTIPEGVTTIEDWAFSSCSSLAEVTIPEGVTTIKNGAFSSCSNLAEVTIPEGVTTIGYSAFAYTGLTEVTIPASVTTIGNMAFGNCTNLTSVTFKETGGWRTKNPYDGAESPDPINVDTPSTNAEKLREGDWHNKYLIRK